MNSSKITAFSADDFSEQLIWEMSVEGFSFLNGFLKISFRNLRWVPLDGTVPLIQNNVFLHKSETKILITFLIHSKLLQATFLAQSFFAGNAKFLAKIEILKSICCRSAQVSKIVYLWKSEKKHWRREKRRKNANNPSNID